ncbi:hypothetical protein B4113_0815 [Geobacillus sp. B4113_201601]|nr:hypothetical protein B4113_0815 [Geobacillus sp. B4113_201601]
MIVLVVFSTVGIPSVKKMMYFFRAGSLKYDRASDKAAE